MRSNSPNTQATVSTIDQQIEALLAKLPDRNRPSFSPQLIALRRRRNALLPIYQLPVELLLSILQRHLHQTQILGRHYSRLLQLSLVSTLFKSLVEDGSELWACIGAGLSIRGVEVCLVKSSNQPLTINLDSTKYAVYVEQGRGYVMHNHNWEQYSEVKRTYEKDFVDRVLPHFSRVRVASLKIGAESWDSIQTVLDSPAPLLVKFKIEGTGQGPFNLPPLNGADAFSGGAPRLKVLNIGKEFHFLADSYKFSGLSSLSIWSDKTLTVHKIITMLSDSPNLSSLTIIEWMTTRGLDPSLAMKIIDGTARDQIDFPILLPKLQDLTLRLEGAERILYLLEHFQGPSCTHLDLRHGRTTAPPHFVQQSLRPFLPAFTHTHGWTDMSVNLGPLSWFRCEDGPSVCIQTSSDTLESPVQVTSLLDWIIEARGNQTSTIEMGLFLREQGVRVDCSRPELLTRLQRLGRIVTLILDGSTSTQEWMRKLMEPNWPTPNETPRFFLPDLVSLYLSGFTKPGKDIMEVLQVRYGKSPVPTGCQPQHLPPPLQLLKIGGPSLGSYTRAVKDIVGERNVKVSKYNFISFDIPVGLQSIPLAINGPDVPHNF
ncbi:hypothetical protein FRC01_007102 [Tulasnella sp. 417]|nr:hypothetical protein FRC01_007102 [Tulasnella sp. 417]